MNTTIKMDLNVNLFINYYSIFLLLFDFFFQLFSVVKTLYFMNIITPQNIINLPFFLGELQFHTFY